jgi:hypothetical protein
LIRVPDLQISLAGTARLQKTPLRTSTDTRISIRESELQNLNPSISLTWLSLANVISVSPEHPPKANLPMISTDGGMSIRGSDWQFPNPWILPA